MRYLRRERRPGTPPRGRKLQSGFDALVHCHSPIKTVSASEKRYIEIVQQHWETVYETKATDQVSWFRPHLETSLSLIERATGSNRAASIIDVGGGASTLVDDLLERGYHNLTVLDISHVALDLARKRQPDALAKAVSWRKTSFGSRSVNGEVTMARLLTVTQTCRMQNRNSLDYLNRAIRSHRLAQPTQSLLKPPGPT